MSNYYSRRNNSVNMKVSIIVFVASYLVVALTGTAEAREQFEPVLTSSRTQSPTTRLLKRSLCNTFGGCGQAGKRSFLPFDGSYPSLSDESSEERRYEAEERMIKEILDGILEHLQKDHNYKQGKYVMYVPKQKRTGALNSRQQNENDDELDRNKQHRIMANELEELRVI